MFINTKKEGNSSRTLEIPLTELRYLLKETFDLELPQNVQLELKNNVILVHWEESLTESYSDLLLSKSVGTFLLEEYEKVKDLYPSPEDYLKAVLDNALNTAKEVVNEDNSKKPS